MAPYLRIAAALQAQIHNGSLAPGARLPSTRQLMQAHGIAMATATKVLSTLKQRGYIQTVPGVGMVVIDRSAPQAATPLDLSRIATVAVALADREGLREVSMRRVAAELQVATMSLYRHVPGKDDLLVAMLNTVYAETPPPAAQGPWREQLRAEAQLMWALCQRHPWVAHVLSVTRPQMAPNGMLHTEFIMQALSGKGLSVGQMLSVAMTLIGFLRGMAVNIEAEKVAEQDSGENRLQYMAARQAEFEQLMVQHRLPWLMRVSQVPDELMQLDAWFMDGVECILDGVQALIDRAASTP